MRRRDESGGVTVFVVTLTAALMLMAGLVLDGGHVIAAQRAANDVAEAAARAGAQELDETSIRSGTLKLNEGAVDLRVQQYLSATEYIGTARVSGATVTVEVTGSVRLRVLGLIGLRTSTIRGTGHATPEQGVVRGEGGT